MSTPKSLISLLLLLLPTSILCLKLTAPLLQQQIGQQIFHQNKLYMILVTNNPSPNQKIVSMFNQYCEDKHFQRLCTVLSGQPNVDRFYDFREFIGARFQVFFSIVDVERRKKYVLPYIQEMTANDIRIFQSKFQQGILQPFYNSEDPDAQPYEKCTKIVGNTLTHFLERQSQIKVLFLYTQHSACQVCGQMLRQYADLAEKLYDKEIVSFGYYDIFKNDHPRIKDEILPYFLIFTKDKTQPFGLEGEKFHELEQTIIQIALKDTDIDLNKFRRDHTLRFDQNGNKIQPEMQYQIDYKIGDDGQITKNAQKIMEEL